MGAAAQQKAGIDRRQRVDILGRIEGIEHRRVAHLRRQRHLDEDAVDRAVVVERAYLRQHVGFARVGGHGNVDGVITELARRFALVADVDLARRIVAHEDGREPRHDAMFALERPRLPPRRAF